MLPKYREHGQVLCWNCGRAGLSSNAPLTVSSQYMGRCDLCETYTAYTLSPDAIVPGDEVFILSKYVDPSIGSYTAYDDKIHSGIATILKINRMGGVLVRFVEHPWRFGVFHPEDLSKPLEPQEMFAIDEDAFLEWDAEFNPPWYKRLWKSFTDLIFGVY